MNFINATIAQLHHPSLIGWTFTGQHVQYCPIMSELRPPWSNQPPCLLQLVGRGVRCCRVGGTPAEPSLPASRGVKDAGLEGSGRG